MKEFIKKLKDKVLNREKIEYDDAIKLSSISIDDNEVLEELCNSANEIREKFCGNIFDLCTITNAKSGKCSEDCKYCAQSAHFKTGAEVYPLISKEKALDEAKKVEVEGANRYSLVTSGRGLNGESEESDRLAEIYKKIQIFLFVLLMEYQIRKL